MCMYYGGVLCSPSLLFRSERPHWISKKNEESVCVGECEARLRLCGHVWPLVICSVLTRCRNEAEQTPAVGVSQSQSLHCRPQNTVINISTRCVLAEERQRKIHVKTIDQIIPFHSYQDVFILYG